MKSLGEWTADLGLGANALRVLRDRGMIAADQIGSSGRGAADLFSRATIAKAMVLLDLQAHGFSGHFLKTAARLLENNPDRLTSSAERAAATGWTRTAERIREGERVVFRFMSDPTGRMWGGCIRAERDAEEQKAVDEGREGEAHADTLAAAVVVTRVDLTKWYGDFLRGDE